MIAGGSATGLSANGAWIIRVLWPMMVASVRLIRAIVQGSSTSAQRDTSEQIETLPRPLSIVLNPLREQRTIPIFEFGLVCRAYLVRL